MNAADAAAMGAPAVRRIATGDGTVTLQRIDGGWAYRSVHGAWREARHVFVESAGLGAGDGPRAVLELGFGAGTNFAATVVARRGRGALRYHAVDHRPVGAADLPAWDELAHALAVQATRDGCARRGEVSLTLQRVEFVSLRRPERFDAVLFDPFGPAEQPDSWSTDAFAVARAHLAPRGRLVTYCAAGWVRRNMAAAGLYVATIPGPPGKREITVAATTPDVLAPWRIRNAPSG